MSGIYTQLIDLLSGGPGGRASAEAEARQIIAAILPRQKTIGQADPAQTTRMLEMAKARLSGMTLQYLTGKAYFYHHEYQVGPGVLVPRPETEILVECAEKKLKHLWSLEPPVLRVGMEIGLGSGMISIELVCQFPLLIMYGSELSSDAIKWAEINRQTILAAPQDSNRLVVLQAENPGHVFEPFETQAALRLPAVDFLISNPPYLSRQDEISEDVLAHEPSCALFAQNENPSFFYEVIARDADRYLKPRGQIFVEIAHERQENVQKCFEHHGWNVKTFLDLTGRARVLTAFKTEPVMSKQSDYGSTEARRRQPA